MVLNKSKWDHKAKIKYLKKHGLTRPKPKNEVTPKWSSKKSSTTKTSLVWDSDSEWDSEDEELVNHFYPEISPQEAPIEFKKKLKKQIYNALSAREGADQDESNNEPDFDDADGIYLGKKPERQGDEKEYDSEDFEEAEGDFDYEIPDLEAKLSDFLILAKPQKSRKLLKNKMLDNFLEEYGIESLQSTVKDIDYNDLLRQNVKNIDKMDLSSLSGHRIGQSFEEPKASHIKVLTEEERKAHLEREKKLEHAKFYNQIKATFGQQSAKKTSRILEINNFNAEDEQQVELLNMRITRNGLDKTFVDDDLDELLGLAKEETYDDKQPDLDDLILKSKHVQSVKPPANKAKPITRDLKLDAFLDDLLGM